MANPMGSFGRILGRAGAGALMGGGAMMGYNALEGRDLNTGVGKGMMFGAGAWLGKGLMNKGGWNNARKMMSNQSSKVGGFFNRHVNNRVYNSLSKSAAWDKELGVGSYPFRRINAGIARTVGGMARGAAIGGVIGGFRGGSDDNGSIIGGAFKGALQGAAIGGGIMAYKSRNALKMFPTDVLTKRYQQGFSKMTNGINKIKHAGV